MFRSKKDVDRHVQDSLRKLKGETERTTRYYNFARLYFQVGDYESTRRYASSFLSLRDDSANGHRLLGQALEALGQKDKAVAEYKCSLMLETNQPDLVLKVCELLADGDIADKGSARFWCDRAEQHFPHNAAVFKLKEKLLTLDGDDNASELEALITSELAVRPKDVSLHVRLLMFYLEKGRVNDAYNMAIEVDMRSAFRDELRWYDCLTDVFKSYRETTKAACGWEFYLHYTSVLERSACLNLQEHYNSPRRSLADCVQALFIFDQILEEASNQSPPGSEQDVYQEFLRHQRCQLCLHFATFLFKKAKKELSNWRDLGRVVAPLLLHCLTPPPDQHGSWLVHATKMRRKSAEWWIKEGSYRNSQAGHVILGLLHHERRTQFLDRVTQFCSGNWRDRVFQKLFNTRDHQQAINTSHFIRHSFFMEPALQLPTLLELRPYDEMSQKLHPGSLHHMVWLGLQEFSNKRGNGNKLGPDFRCLVFDSLQLTCNNLNVAGSETLNRLDIDAFLYAAVLCTRATLEEQQAAGFCNSERPSTLPANITEQLCTVAQAKWWIAAFLVYMNQSRGDLGELRQVLQNGIEVVRVLGNHGLDVRLIVQLARTFSDRASSMASRTESSTDLVAVEARAALYWSSALPLLDKLQRNQAIRAPHTRLFEYQGKELSMAEVNALVEEGRFFLACQLMKEDKHEKAIEAFQQLKSPYASFYQAQIYKKLAALELEEKRGELITSEMRSQHIILLTKVRENLYLTLDRLRSPGVDPKHPLNAELSIHIEEIESQLARIDPDVWRSDVNRNDLDAISDGSASSVPSGGENINSLSGFNNSTTYLHLTPKHLSGGTRLGSTTPYRHRVDSDTPAQEHTRRTEARPSPERLEAQIRQMMHGRDSLMQTLVQQNKVLIESNKNMASSLAKMAQGMDDMKNLIQELVKKESSKRNDVQLNADLPQVCDAEDDLYVFDDDYSEEVNMAANHLSQYQPFPPYPNYPGYRQMSGILGTSTVTYGPPPPGEAPAGVAPPLLPPGPPMGSFFRNMDPALMYSQTLGYYGQGALPFSEGQQLPDFRGPPVASSVFSRLSGNVVPVDSPNVHNAAKLVQPPVAPVNVVITSSDTLPTTAPLTQPTLSVTIPPQHRLGTPLVHVGSGVSVLGQPTVAGPLPPPPPMAQTSVITTQSTYPLSQATPYSHSLTVTSSTSAATSNSSSVPHAFQISMPPQAQLPEASRLEKGAAALSPVLPISTQTLLSSVPSPVYSAVVPDRSPAIKDVSSPPKPHRISTGSAVEEEEEDTEHDPCPDFQPVIPLPAEVEITTGEEEEILLFESRCKLFRFVEKEWKERGVGMLKLMHHKENGKVRALMRREQVLKVCANHFLSADMELAPINDRAWMWVANDFADEKVKLEKLCARFKTADEAANFHDAFNQARELAKKAKPSPVKGSDKVVASTPLTVQKEQSPDTATPTSTTSSEKIVVGGFTFSYKPIFNMNPATSQTTTDKDAGKEEKTAGSPKSSPFLMFSFGNLNSKTSQIESTQPVSTATDEPPPLRRPHSTTSPSPSDGTNLHIAPPEKGKAGGDRLMFNSTISTSFSNLAASVKDNGNSFKTDSNFKGFEGAGKPLFGGAARTSLTQKNTSTGPAGDEDTTDDFVPTVEFKPVVPLPELVEVKTGEEGEEVLFKERAKLLRYDSDAKEWKERGRGQMKVLKDPISGRIRLLMRREQVLKVCCNHNLQPTIQFNALSTSDRAWTWYAQDYSDGEMKTELFALKFKTVEQAQSFKAVIDELQAKMKDGGIVGSAKVQPDVWKCENCLFPNAGGSTKCRSCSKSKGGGQNKEAQNLPKLSELFRPSPGSWECKACYLQNSAQHEKCASCGDSNPTKTPVKVPFTLKSGLWECKECNHPNENTRTECASCEADRSDVTKTKAVTSTPLNKQNGPSPRPLSEMFKPKAGTWECKTCYIRNENVIQCIACSTPKPGCEAAAKEAEMNSSGMNVLNLGTSSGGFTFGIPAGSSESGGDSGGFKFGIPTQPSTTSSLFAAPTTKTEFTFGMPIVVTTSVPQPATPDPAKTMAKPFTFEPKLSSAPFQFGGVGSSTEGGKVLFNFDSPSKRDAAQVKEDRNFVFGSPSSFTFNFSGVRPKSPVKSPKSPGVLPASGEEEESGSEPEEDEGEHIFFQPVIPLPDKVPIHTGEEEEDILYSHRAKLYRFVNGEWKERGVGDIKVLKHRTTHKVRLLMRREQVLKICLNHQLTPDLSFVEKDEKSWLWAAVDFSEGEMKKERFALRFQTKEIAAAFKKVMDRAQMEIGSPSKSDGEAVTDGGSSAAKEHDAGSETSSAMKNFTFALSDGGEVSSTTPKFTGFSGPGSIQDSKGVARSLFEDISSDTMESDVSYISDVGEHKKDEANEVEEVYRVTVTPEERVQALSLGLPENFYAYRGKPPCPGCPGCEPDSESEESKSVVKPNQTEAKGISRSENSPQVFKKGIIAPPVFSAANTSSLFTSKSLSTTTATTTSVSSSQASSTIVQAPAMSAISSPIFGQPSVFGQSTKGSLFSQPVPQTGTPKSIFGQPSNTPSQPSSFSSLVQQTSLPLMFGQNTSTTPPVFSQTTSTPIFGQGSVGTAAPKFGEGSSTSLFSQMPVSFTQHRTGFSIFPEENTQDASNTKSVFGQVTTSESSDKPVFGQITSTFSVFGQSEMPGTGSIFGQMSGNTNTVASATPVFGLQPSTSEVTPTCSSTSVFSVKPSLSFAPTSESSQQQVPFSFEFGSAKSSTGSETAGTFSFSLPNQEEITSDAKASTPESKADEGVPFLPTQNSLSFATMAQKQPLFPSPATAPADSTKPFAWADAGATIFGNSPLTRSPHSTTLDKTSSPKTSGRDSSDEEGGGGGSGEDSTYDPHFEPIIALPDAIEVRTGEEDEIKVFCQRGKLFRYEASTKEWKERGIGEMKILKHPVQGTYRLLLRREQVFKVVCNQRVMPDMELKPLATSDRSWCWGGMNHAEEEARLEELAVRFKYPEIAQEFYTKLQECIADINQRLGAKSTAQVSETRDPDGGLSESEEEEELEDVDEEEDEVVEEEEDEGSERNLMFEKRATLHRRQQGSAPWTLLGQGDLQVVYDPDCFGARICVIGDGSDANVLCNTIIAMNTELVLRKKDCEWTALDYSEDPPTVQSFMARFSSETSANEFQHVFNEGKEVAKQSDIVDELDPSQVLED